MKCFAICCLLLAVSFNFKPEVVKTLRQQILRQAAWAMRQQSVTVTAQRAARSAGTIHDFFSEGDYWWPNPQHADSPYVQRDGITNPENFTAHRKAMIRFSQITGALASAYVITRDEKYVAPVVAHCRAWFVDTATLMNPHLRFAQAIKGRATGRGIGIIDTIHFMEVVQALLVMQDAKTMDKELLQAVRNWFGQYLQWLTSHAYGKEEMNAANNHGTCWVMQVAAFARFTGDAALLQFCSDRYKQVLLPNQMAADGSFPLELKRTKSYGYSIFNLDAMVTICQILDLWNYSTPDGRSIRKGVEYLYPFVKNKSLWPKAPDVMYWRQWPVAQPFLVFAGVAFGERAWIDTWKTLDHSPEVEEVIRNLPIRNPVIWL